MFFSKTYFKLKPRLAVNFSLHTNRRVGNVKEKINSDIILTTMEGARINSLSDWINVRKAMLEHENNRGQFNKYNIDAVIIGYCANNNKYNMASSYLSFLSQENIKPNLATLGKYLKVLYMKNYEKCLQNAKTCPKKEEDEILRRSEDIRKQYPILDAFTLENVIAALSLTSQWKNCLPLLQEIKIIAVPNTLSYSAVISAAFLNNEEQLGWKLLEEMLEYEKIPIGIAYLSYIRSIRKIRKRADAISKLERLFSFFQENDLKCRQDVALSIGELSEKLEFHKDFTTVAYKGICKSCQQRLNNFDLSDEEFVELKNGILKNVIVGRDLFVKTNPEELEQFKEFVGSMGKFDVVLDGLNVAYSAGNKHSPQVLSALVASVVAYFVQQNKKVLVLGRVHMSRWPMKNWGYIKQNAMLFLTQNISQDDPYLLYCALNSGKDTIIVTRDLMRGHKFLLKNPRLKALFNRWLSQRQYQLIRVDDHRGPTFRIPPPFSLVAQKNGNNWHIPYEPDASKVKNEFHRTWLCLKC